MNYNSSNIGNVYVRGILIQLYNTALNLFYLQHPSCYKKSSRKSYRSVKIRKSTRLKKPSGASV